MRDVSQSPRVLRPYQVGRGADLLAGDVADVPADAAAGEVAAGMVRFAPQRGFEHVFVRPFLRGRQGRPVGCVMVGAGNRA